MPHPPTITCQLTNWYFDQRHNLCGLSKGHKDKADGTEIIIVFIKSITEYSETYLVRTHTENFELIKKDSRQPHKTEETADALEYWRRR